MIVLGLFITDRTFVSIVCYIVLFVYCNVIGEYFWWGLTGSVLWLRLSNGVTYVRDAHKYSKHIPFPVESSYVRST